MELRTGELFQGKYEISHLLGEGAYGRVYKARQHSLDRDVAVKLLQLNDAAAQQRFALEAKIIARLQSPYTVRVYDYGEIAGTAYMVLEFIAGRTLRDVLDWRGPMEPSRVVSILVQVLESLREAHDLGIVHRDLKPQNLMLSQPDASQMIDHIKILDFGMAKLTSPDLMTPNLHITRQGAIVGTLRYMAPEQARGQTPGPATDIFTLGLMAYEMLSGEHPYAYVSNDMMIAARLAGDDPVPAPKNVKLSPGLAVVLARMTAKRIEDRYRTANAIIDDLDAMREETKSLEPTQERPNFSPEWISQPRPAGERSYVSLTASSGAKGGPATAQPGGPQAAERVATSPTPSPRGANPTPAKSLGPHTPVPTRSPNAAPSTAIVQNVLLPQPAATPSAPVAQTPHTAAPVPWILVGFVIGLAIGIGIGWWL